MPFGNGVSYNKPADAGELRGILKDVAVECYFMPLKKASTSKSNSAGYMVEKYHITGAFLF
ncbi:MAG: hypothetical protein E7B11_27400 [Clostridiales bacterium]|nr:hypothetical protein [Clostridiales bacterium]